MSFKFTFREITPEDTEILRMLKLRNAKPEEHICCEILRGDGITEEPQLYIVPSYFAPELVTARDPESGEEFVIFDGGRHGYDNMFCEEHDPAELKNRPLKRYEIPASKLVLELGYSVDYENEKEDFEPDEADTVELINGERMPWEQVKRDGIDYIALYYVNEEGKQIQILDAELA